MRSKFWSHSIRSNRCRKFLLVKAQLSLPYVTFDDDAADDDDADDDDDEF